MKIDGAPNWMQALALLFRRFPESHENRHVSAVIAPPSVPYFGAASALAALEIRSECTPDVATNGGKVATIVGNEFRDVTYHDNPFRLDGSRFAPEKAPPTWSLPTDFPERRPHSISAESSQLLIELDGTTAALKLNWELLNASAQPVLVICRSPKLIAEKLKEQLVDFAIWSPIQRVAAAEPGQLVSEWFRSPILLVSTSGLKQKKWVRDLRPRAVIHAGMSAWESRYRWLWPETPHVLLLEPTSDDIFRFRDWFSDREIQFESDVLSEFHGVHGLPVKLFAESPGVFGGDGQVEDLEDLYE